MTTMYYDIHNHLFNKNFLARELLYRLMKEMRNQLGFRERLNRGESDQLRGLKGMIRKLRRYSHAMSVFCRKNSAAIFDELDKTYKGEFILTPLTFDLTWCFAPTADREAALQPGEATARDFRREADRFFGSVESGNRLLTPGELPESEEGALWRGKYLREKERFLENAGKLLDADRQLSRVPGAFRGWEEQIRQLAAMKEDPRYRERVFPFLAVDPRRPGIYDYALAHVGRGKLFAGIKLYCPNGYSPTDPLLYGPKEERGGIYAFCEDHGIPVTTHNSLGGFATFAKSVVITGDIWKDGKLLYLDQESVRFRDSFLGSEGVHERAMTLNHPLLWQKVVAKYPRLRLNLAHFGGGTELGNALTHPGDPSLWSNRIIALLQDPRYQVYTDLSCFTEFRVLRKLITHPLYSGIRHRILFGSDYTLLLLFEDNFNGNIRKFRTLFGEEFRVIAGDNPREFLKHVL